MRKSSPPPGAGSYFRRGLASGRSPNRAVGFPPFPLGSKGDESPVQTYQSVAANKMSLYDRGKYRKERIKGDLWKIRLFLNPLM